MLKCKQGIRPLRGEVSGGMELRCDANKDDSVMVCAAVNGSEGPRSEKME